METFWARYVYKLPAKLRAVPNPFQVMQGWTGAVAKWSPAKKWMLSFGCLGFVLLVLTAATSEPHEWPKPKL